MVTQDLSTREVRLLRYALGWLEVSLNEDLAVEAAQEVSPETQATAEPLPDVRVMIADLRAKLRPR